MNGPRFNAILATLNSPLSPALLCNSVGTGLVMCDFGVTAKLN